MENEKGSGDACKQIVNYYLFLLTFDKKRV